MKIDILLIGPNLKYNHGPAKGFELLIDGLKKNGIRIKVIKGFNFSLLNIIYIFFVKKIYIISFPEKILYIIVKIFKNKKFLIGADIPLKHIKISSEIYSKKNVLKIFNTFEIMKYYTSIYNKKTYNKPVVHGHGINIEIEKYKNKKNTFFLYYKNINKLTKKNTQNIFIKVKNFLDENKINYTLIEYGKYNYNDWIDILKDIQYGIFITSIEGYGIAKLEALNYNIPILNFEQNKGITIRGEILTNRSTFPIFENGFGEKFYNFEDFKTKFQLIQKNKYSPKKIIEEKYCHIKKAKSLYKLFDNFKNEK